ncbi:uncharacterized protein LOC113567459 [Drosophila persimilis]|uniref:uncharacterized protein LOC113567459 n=1 Tax=Drosophila persimilis TaxID=7234 RepID=UPI000F08EB8E|nr:uncharacterized protein LOC113567459 [Drosophila persimilis]
MGNRRGIKKAPFTAGQFVFGKHFKRYGKVHDRNSNVCRSFQEAMSEIQKAVSQPSSDVGYLNMVAHLEEDCGQSDSDSDSDAGTLDLRGAELKEKCVPFRHIVADSDTDTETSSEPKKTLNSQ